MKIEKYVLGFVAVALLSGVALAGDQPAPKAPPRPQEKVAMKAPPEQKHQKKPAAGNYKVTFKIAAGGAEGSGSVLVLDGVQVNYRADKEVPVETADETGKKAVTGTKKISYVANFLPVSDSANSAKVVLQAQFELTSSGKSGKFSMIQMQVEVLAEKGKTLVLVEDADKHIEVMVEDAQ